MKTISKLLGSGCLFFILIANLSAQPDPAAYQAYLSNSLTLWERVIQQKQEAYTKNPDAQTRYALALAQYGLLNCTMASQNEEAFDQYYDMTVDLLDELIDENPDWAEPHSILSSVYGFSIAYSSWKGMFMGPMSSNAISEAYKLDSSNPLVNKLYGGSKLYTPEMFGGDAEQALEYFTEAVKGYEQRGDTVNNWLYLDAVAHSGITCNKLKRHGEALAFYEKAIAIEPKFAWVSENLLPKTQKVVTSK